MRHLVWFRHDLRIQDNRALFAACADPKAQVFALFIATPQQWVEHAMSSRQAEFIRQNIECIANKLTSMNIHFLYREVALFADIPDVLAAIITKYNINALFFNRQYEWNEQQRDTAVISILTPNLPCYSFDDQLLTPPGTVKTACGEMFKVFTPFRRALLTQLFADGVQCLPAPTARLAPQVGTLITETITPFSYPCETNPFFPAGEQAALQRLRLFCHQYVSDYHQYRDIPALSATSRLSAYLSIGVLSVRQCFNRLRLAHPEDWNKEETGSFSWLNELIWREFYHHLLAAHPKLCRYRPFIAWTDYVPWKDDATLLNAWQQGKTGYPIVDAAMRQLNATGWMHNRLRMITASFFTKDLQLDWRLGERYFMQQLVDGNFAANNGGWQWSASTGTDATPYFRIFNPTTQGQRFDPQGHFVREWLPELSNVPDKFIHTPHVWAEKTQIELIYPKPIIEHAIARQETLLAFEQAKLYSKI
ncbi:MAG: deoxyribodipyrimidine photo-lyase [Plesiomonas sp.]|uniref:deoxyribodipyrimidine photo-lyase n=1 Tax=Plesiomonas sp. TaxID=2486279 RepID=UPI003F3AB230